MLGRPYVLGGEVVQGAGRGAELGWPTLNLRTPNPLLPADGVYVSRVRLDAGESRAAVTNVGCRPTFSGNSARIVETHVLDYHDSAYGRQVEVELLRRLRPEQAFASVEELVEQIGRDVAQTREYFRRSAR